MNTLLAPEPLIFVDLETSGANFANDRIIEIGLIEVDQSGTREWSVLVNPERPLSPFITGLTGIDDAMLDSAPPFREVAPVLLDRLRGRLFIAHNARFDYGFLKSEFRRLGMDFRAPNLCTVKLSRKLFPQHYRHNLDTLVERHGLSVAGDRHRALADARVLWDLWQCWHRLLPVDAIRDAVTTIVGRPHLPAQLDAALLDDLPEAAGAYALYDEHDHLLLVRHSSNLRQQVLAHFTIGNRDTVLFRNTWRIEWRDAAGELGARLRAIELAGSASPGDPAPPATRRGSASAWRPQSSVRGNSGSLRRVTSDRNSFFHRTSILLWLTTCSAFTRIVERPCAACAHWLMPSICVPGSSVSRMPQRREPAPPIGRRTAVACALARKPVGLHSVRLMTALAKLKVKAWPYKGPVLLIEQDEFGMREDAHLVDRWRLVATLHSEEALQACLAHGPTARDFDPAIYRIVNKFLQAGKVRVRPLPPFSL
jgi:DNA polymerase-3 subunit epsilon